MSKLSCMRLFGLTRLISGSVGLAAVFGVLFLAAMPAVAGVSVGVTPTFPATARRRSWVRFGRLASRRL